MTAAPRTVGVVEDDPHFRAYLRGVIDKAPGLVCAFACETINEAGRLHAEMKPDLYLVDLALPDGSGVDLIRHIAGDPVVRILVLSVLGDRASVMDALKAGAHGYILKDARAAQIVESITQTLEGYSPISPQVAIYLTRLLSEPGRRTSSAGEETVALTAREAEILSIFARGLTYREAAEALAVSPHTISDFVKKIYRKLNVHTRSEAVFEARYMGLLDFGD